MLKVITFPLFTVNIVLCIPKMYYLDMRWSRNKSNRWWKTCVNFLILLSSSLASLYVCLFVGSFLCLRLLCSPLLFCLVVCSFVRWLIRALTFACQSGKFCRNHEIMHSNQSGRALPIWCQSISFLLCMPVGTLLIVSYYLIHPIKRKQSNLAFLAWRHRIRFRNTHHSHHAAVYCNNLTAPIVKVQGNQRFSAF